MVQRGRIERDRDAQQAMHSWNKKFHPCSVKEFFPILPSRDPFCINFSPEEPLHVAEIFENVACVCLFLMERGS